MLSYIIMAPSNYQGGGGAFGNRFFVNIYPAFLFLITAISSLRPLFVSWIIGAVFLAPSLLNPFQTSWSPAFHAYRGLFRLLPVELTLIDTLPTNVNPHMMQSFYNETPPFRLYYFDDHAYDFSRSTILWVKGKETLEFAVRTFTPQDYLTLTLTNGPIGNQVDVEVAGVTRSVIFEAARETKRLVFPLEWFMPYFTTNRIYPVKIRSHNGFIPRFTVGSQINVMRNLGCRVHISLDPFDIGKALRENQQPHEAIQLLAPLLRADPKDIFVRYELALAYQQAGMLDAAKQELVHCQALFPEFQKAFITHCEIRDETCAQECITDKAELNGDLANFLQPLMRSYEAEHLHRSTGQVVVRQDASNQEVVAFTPDSDLPGFLVYGPFSEYQPGSYQARFRTYLPRLQEFQPVTPAPPVFIEVFDQKQGIIARKAVTPGERFFADAAPFQEDTLNFDLASPGILEFRVYATGLASASVDRIDVYPRLPLQIYQSLAQVSLEQAASQQALEYAQQLLDVVSHSSEFQLLYLHALQQTGQWDKILELFKTDLSETVVRTGIASVLFESVASIEHQELRTFLEEFSARFVPVIPLQAAFAGKIALMGYDISASKLNPGDHFSIEYVWKALEPMNADYAFFVHFIKKGEWLTSETTSKIKRRLGFRVRQMFQQDHEPLHGAYPTSHWLRDELIREGYDVVIPSVVEPGTYEIWIGVWNPLTKIRLESQGATRVKLGEIVIWPKNGSNG